MAYQTYLDQIGKVYNGVTILGLSHKYKYFYLKCLCSCGTEFVTSIESLLAGHTKSCGCIKRSQIINLVGRNFNGIIVTRFIKRKNRKAYWECKCHCSKIFITRGDSLTRNKVKSCGCLKKTYNFRHGFGGIYSDPLKFNFYKNYTDMVYRCTNPNNRAYQWYGGRGIKVCKRWLGKKGFIHFVEDMWKNFLKHYKANNGDTSIDRILVNGTYKPSNCRWATWDEQSNNKRTTTKSLDIEEHNKWKHKISSAMVRCSNLEVQKSILVETYVGVSVPEFRKYIESLWTRGMTWNNYGRGPGKWQFDHIVGCNNFDLSIEKDRYRCYNIKNLHPMWWKDHIKKSQLRVLA